MMEIVQIFWFGVILLAGAILIFPHKMRFTQKPIIPYNSLRFLTWRVLAGIILIVTSAIYVYRLMQG